jgi:hypothetical protein
MTAGEVFRQAMRLLGYTDTLGELDGAAHGESYKRALTFLNQLVCEVSLAETGALPEPLTSLRDEVPLSDRAVRDVLPCGMAMQLALSQGDSDKQAVFAALYNQKRVALRTAYERRRDTLPRGWDA